MQKVTGIGGIFFKARDPAGLANWYRQHLGIDSAEGHADFEWSDAQGQKGRTVWALFPQDSDYLAAARSGYD